MSVVTGLSTAPKLCSLLTLKLIKFHQKIKKETDLHSLVLLRNKSREWVLRQFSAVFLSLQNLLFFILPSMNNNVSLSQGYWDASLGCSLLHPIRIIILCRICIFGFLQKLIWYLVLWVDGSAAALDLSWRHPVFILFWSPESLLSFFAVPVWWCAQNLCLLRCEMK